ncbi:P-loop NTPase fold protein [Nocardia sp. CDC159]|uniref:P-loop NTPase fold protein n=1 Tax=Nocardia pulmonis TaxID=2951408 RepID=A0A9X2EBT6_9NOCA|nr:MULTISPECIES: P-loop NTPase fold protein [Nocardia]MCM6777514.1 P-loop NTPase fold protein [Nocardia pulmonis]MCM6790379.1 P-loop NTPase fold protein [Nocardia sp. CDC159]
MAGAPETIELGTIDGVQFAVAETSEPWALEIDAIVVSVGSGLGLLGGALRNRFPDAAWDEIPYRAVTSEQPYVLPLPAAARPGMPLARAILVSVHGREVQLNGIATGDVTDESVHAATVRSLEVARATGARAIGLPLLATGALGLPARSVARVMVPAAVATMRKMTERGADKLIFICQRDVAVEAIRAEFEAVAAAVASPELAGGVCSDLVDPNRGIPLSHDRLGVAPYVSMLATVIADQATPLPLSLGVFGEWGSGKSFFMAMLRDRIDGLAMSGNPRYCREIVQIGFNAWHYTDTNLWASLGDEIFRQLAGTGASASDRAERLRAELAERLDQRRQLELATEQARATVARLQAQVNEAVARRESTALNLLDALRNSETFRHTTDLLWRELGIADAKEQAHVLVGELDGSLDEADTLRRASRSRIGLLSLTAAVALLGLGLLIPALAAGMKNYLALGSGLSALVTGLGGLAYLASRGHSGLRKLRQLSEELRGEMHDAAERAVGDQMAGTLAKLRAAQADQRVAQAQLDDVIAHVGELGRRLAQLAPGQRLYTFLAERAQGDAYAGNLGLVSTIRKDFEQLVTLMNEWRADPHPADGRRPIDRVVLYIDDLDRCSPAQVVDVLQAVHLLLAFELFVVVVGVDPRWLLRSLRSRYADLLLADAADDNNAHWHSPEDYLEKILNVPLILPRMSAGGLGRLLQSFAGPPPGPQREESGAVNTRAPLRGRPMASDDVASIPIEPGSEVATQQLNPIAAEPPHPLTEPELTVLGAFDLFVETPREAKRMLNLYRMIRATRDLSSSSRFLGLDGRPGEFEAVAVLLGMLAAQSCVLGAMFDATPNPGARIGGGLAHRRPDLAWSDFVADLEPRWSGSGRSNGIVGTVPDNHVAHWYRLYRGLLTVSKVITFTDLRDLQLWLPRIRCFSYVILPAVAPPPADAVRDPAWIEYSH